jgi:phosphate transport system protein
MFTSTRSLLDQELSRIRDHIVRLASMVDAALAGAMEALVQRNVTQAHAIITQDRAINILRYEIEEECLRILATQQPAARDLRAIVAATHIAIELERMADHAAGIARLVELMEGEPGISSLHQLPKMAKRAHQMISESMDAYINHSLAMAHKLIKHDDKLDKHNRNLFHETIEDMRDDAYVRRATYLLWVGHNLERIGDRATNIAERVIFMVTGQFTEIHQLPEDSPLEAEEPAGDTAS